jgi:hypothetical protein
VEFLTLFCGPKKYPPQLEIHRAAAAPMLTLSSPPLTLPFPNRAGTGKLGAKLRRSTPGSNNNFVCKNNHRERRDEEMTLNTRGK